MIKYIGSKRLLVNNIIETVETINSQDNINTIVDLFTGSTRVAYAFKKRNFYTIANDLNTYSYILAKCFIESNAKIYTKENLSKIFEHLNSIKPKFGWFTQKYSIESRYIQPKNGEKIQAIREEIEKNFSYDENLKAILLTSLIIAADKVDSTVGIQMAYLKSWSKRSYNDLRLDYPPLLEGNGLAYNKDALELVDNLHADLFYLDPPYNSHSYLGNYHLWETLVKWDNPETYGIANKRAEVKTKKSKFNKKNDAKKNLNLLVENIKAKHILLSFNNEGFLGLEEIVSILENFGYTKVLQIPYKRYIGAKLGVYNNKGEKVGTFSHDKNIEYLFISTKNKSVYNLF